MGEFGDGYEPKKHLNPDRSLKEYLQIAQGHVQLEEFKLSDGGKKPLSDDAKIFIEEYRTFLTSEVQKAVTGAEAIRGRNVADIKKIYVQSMVKRFQGWFEGENQSALLSFAENTEKRLVALKAKTGSHVPAPFQPRGMASLVSEYATPVSELQPQLDRLNAVQKALAVRIPR